MKNYLLLTGSVTLAQRGRDFLQRRGIKASLKRVQSGEIEGCGYGILVSDRAYSLARKLLQDEKIPVKAVREVE